MASKHLTASVGTFEEKKKELLSSPGPHYVLFNADPDPSTGLPWCPDCVRTVPAVVSVVTGKGGSLLEVQVGPRTSWKTPNHPFRLDPVLKLTGIPTVLKLGADGQEVSRLGPQLEACGSVQEAQQLMEKFTS